MNTTEVSAAKKTKIKVTSVKFSPKSFDVTLEKEKTIKATPSNWSKAFSDQLTKGKWKVSKVVFKKATPQPKKKYFVNGYWDAFWRWHAGYWVTPIKVSKPLATVKVNNKATFELFEGNPTHVTLAASPASSVKATGTMTYTAKLTSGNKPVANAYVIFNFYGESINVSLRDKSRMTCKAKTNASGIATLTLKKDVVSLFTNGESYISCISSFAGTAKKYKVSSSANYTATKVEKEKLIISSFDTSAWDGHSGSGSYSAKVVDESGKGVEGVPIKFYLDSYASSNSRVHTTEANVTTDANGVATVHNLDISWYKGGYAILRTTFGYPYESAYYAIGESVESEKLPMEQGIMRYTIPILQLLKFRLQVQQVPISRTGELITHLEER